EGVAELAAGTRWASMEMAVEEQGAAEDLVQIEGCEAASATSCAEPAIGEKHRSRMMVDIDGQLQPLAQNGAKRKIRQDRCEIDLHDPPVVRIDHARGGDAEPERVLP